MAAGAKHPGSQPRPKHVPQRTCVACRRTEAKRGLIRVVRDAEGRVTVDPTGKQKGRGAYLCHDPACWTAAIKRRALERA
ncbi:MAG: RNase P modulator RnpM, partial [Chloroflexaceae bacterium]